MSYKILYVSVAALLTANASTSVSANEISQHLSTIIIPEPIKRIPPKYPIEAARQSREGWTVLGFVIDEKGNVSDALVKESSGSKDFDKAALKAVTKWKYQPAFENGKPIQQCVNTVQMNFRMGKNDGIQGVSRSFKRKYDLADKALKDKDYQEVEHQLAKMNARRTMHLSENNYMHILAANYAREIGNDTLQLYHLDRVTLDGGVKSEKLKFSVLYQQFYLEAALSKFQSAFNTYEQLIKLEEAKPYLAKLEKLMADIDSVISSDKDIMIKAAIDSDYWYADLVRNKFSLTNIEGSLHTLDVRCANKRHVYTVENNNTWTIPTNWKNCSIYVFGEPKTNFNLIEHSTSS